MHVDVHGVIILWVAANCNVLGILSMADMVSCMFAETVESMRSAAFA